LNSIIVPGNLAILTLYARTPEMPRKRRVLQSAAENDGEDPVRELRENDGYRDLTKQ